MRLFVQFPTRNRVSKFHKYLFRYISYLERPDLCTIHISCDSDDKSMRDNLQDFANLESPTIYTTFDSNKTKIEAINAGIPDSGWDILLLASDDMWPVVRGYDEIIRKEMQTHFPDLDGVLHFNDGHKGEEINTLAILGKTYYDRFGYIYNPIYNSVYCDTEFMYISRNLKKSVYFDRVLIQHLHPAVTKELKDTLHKRNLAFNRQDKRTWKKRKRDGFTQ